MVRNWIRRWQRRVFGTTLPVQRKAATSRPSILSLEQRLNPGFGVASLYPTAPPNLVSPRAVAIADVTGDGKPDLVVANYGTQVAGGTVSVLSGAAGFTGPAFGLNGLSPVAVAVGDVNNDGKPDIVTANANNSNDISILLGTGGGNFQPAIRRAVGTGQVGLVLGDFNKDGRLDVAVLRNSAPNTSTVTVLLNSGTAAIFPNTGGTSFAVGPRATQIVGGLLDVQDGLIDLAVATVDGVRVLRGTNSPAAGSFALASTFDTGDNLTGLALGDINCDGKLDIVTAGSNGTGLFVNTSTRILVGPPPPPTFTFGFTQASANLFPGITPTAVVLTDLNNDGKGDVAIGDATGVDVRLGHGDLTFETASTHFNAKGNAVGTRAPTFIAAGDLNRDGQPDVATVNTSTNDVSVLLNTAPPQGKAAFPTPRNFVVGNSPKVAIVNATNLQGQPRGIVDFNGDGNADIVSVNYGSNTVTVLLGDGRSNFLPALGTPNALGPTPTSAQLPIAGAVADLDGDGNQDIVIVNNYTGNVSVLLGTGGGTFFPAVNYGVGSYPTALALADFNGDGIADVITSNSRSNDVTVLLGNGDGTFQGGINTAVSPMTGHTPAGLAVGDFNEDGILDVAVATNDTLAGNHVQIMLGNEDPANPGFGDGTFTNTGSMVIGGTGSNMNATDFNLDGHLDLAVVAPAGPLGNGIYVFEGDGSGGFTRAPLSPFTVGNVPINIAVGDVNGDGLPDMVVANFTGANVFINKGNFVFQAGPTQFGGLAARGAVSLADMNGDGLLDAVVAEYYGSKVSVVPGHGDGTFDLPPAGQVVARTQGQPSVNPVQVVSADVDGDGKPDLLIVNQGNPPAGIAPSISVELGDGAGGFFDKLFDDQNPPNMIPLSVPGSGPVEIAVGDFNRDGLIDFAVADSGSNDVDVFLNKPTDPGEFDSPITATTMGTGTRTLVVADVNGDGRLDIITANYYSSDVTVLLGNGNGTFTLHPPPPPPPPATPPNTFDIAFPAQVGPPATPRSPTFYANDIAVGDFNGDGRPDLAVSFGSYAAGAAGGVSIMLGNGAGDFVVQKSPFSTAANPTPYAVPGFPDNVAVADVNGDGILDVVTGNYFGTASVLLGNGNGTFKAPASFTAGRAGIDRARDLKVADMNGDGNADILFSSDYNDVVILAGRGDGTFLPGQGFFVNGANHYGGGPVGIAVDDFNCDGVTDLASANLASTNEAGLPTFTTVLGIRNKAEFLQGIPDPALPLTPPGATPPSTPQVTAGVSFSFTVNALTISGIVPGLVDTRFTDTVVFSTTDFQGTVPSPFTFHLLNDGTATFTATLRTAGVQTIFFTDTADPLVRGSFDIVVNPAAPSQLIVGGFPNPTTAGATGSITVTAFDQFGNLATNYRGTVTFTSSDPQATLPANYAFTAADAGSHTFNNLVLKTAGTQSITAKDNALGASGSQTGIVVNPAAASKITVAGYPSPTFSGVSHTFTVTAFDPFNNVATGYTGTLHFTSTDPKAVLPADYTFTGAGAGKDNGTHTFSATLVTGGTQSITATDTKTATITASQTGILVRVAASMDVSGYPSPTIAGASHTFTVTVKDQFGAVADGYVGTVHFTSSDPQAILPADYTFTGAGTGKDNGVHTFSATLKTAPTQSITVTDTVNGATGSQTGIVVQPLVPTKVTVTGFPNPATAGAAGNFTVTAVDQFGNLSTVYTGTVHFTSSDPQAVLPADYTFTGTDAGVHVFSATLETVGTQSITVTDTTTASINGSQSGIVVNPAAADHFTVIGYPTPVVAGSSGSVTVHAFDPFGNTDTNYAGTVHFTSTDPQAVLPSDYTFTITDKGVHTFSGIVFKTAGTQTITVADAAKGGVTGFQSGIVITPGAPATITVVGGSGQKARINAAYGTPFQVLIKDAFGNPVPGVSVTFTAPSSGPSGTFAGGGRTATVTTDAAGKATAPAYSANAVPGKYTVTAATAGLGAVSFALLNSQPLYAVGADAGATPYVAVYDATTGKRKFQFYAYDPAFRGGVRVAVGDVNGDGVSDIITAAGKGGSPHVRVFNGVTGIQLPGTIGSFDAYAHSFTGGVFVAAADVNGDGQADIITGAGAGAGPDVSVFDGKTGTRIHEFFAQAPNFTGGVPVAAGDVNGDGFADVIAGAAAGGAPAVLIYNGNTTAKQLPLLSSFFAYSRTFTGGVNVGAGDVNGDGKAEVITGMGPGKGSKPEVRTFNGVTGAMLSDFFAFDLLTTVNSRVAVPNTSGVRVAGFDFNGDGFADVIAGQGSGQSPKTRIFDGRTNVQLTEFNGADPSFLGGIWVGGG